MTEAGANELSVPLLSLSVFLYLSIDLPFLLSFSVILRWIRRCPVHWHLSKDSGFFLRTWQLRARGAEADSLPPQLADVACPFLSRSFFPPCHKERERGKWRDRFAGNLSKARCLFDAFPIRFTAIFLNKCDQTPRNGDFLSYGVCNAFRVGFIVICRES